MPTKLTREEYLARVADFAPNIKILGRFKLATDPIRARCKDCGTSFTRPAHVNYHKGCPRCVRPRNRIRQGNQEDYLDALRRHRKQVELLEPYTRLNSLLSVRCGKCGKTIRRCARHHIDRACPGCRDGRTRTQRKIDLINRLGGKCQRCGYSRCLAALEFHHRNPQDKSFMINATNMSFGWKKILEEVDKCDLLCSNCHREVHAGFHPEE